MSTIHVARYGRSAASATEDGRQTVRNTFGPTLDTSTRYDTMNQRHASDDKYIQEYDALAINDHMRHRHKSINHLIREPSYTRFKVPFPMICQERYSQAMKKYERQFCSEITRTIDNQPSAREATYFVRVVSYTTLWPPYHNGYELNDTSRRFYKLTPSERKRFDRIMSSDFSYL